jgi:hypothetical protein
MEVPSSDGKVSAGVGLSASNILSRNSDPRLAYEILLDRTDRELRSPMHSRETMIEFKEDWELLQAAAAKNQPHAANVAAAAASAAKSAPKPAAASKSTSSEPSSAPNNQR